MNECERCSATEKLINHHISYEPEVTQVVCIKCHSEIHASGIVPRRPEGFRYPDNRENKATIKISYEARDALLALGRKGESYDAVIRRFICGHVEPILGELADWMRPLIDPILEKETSG